MPTYEDPTNTRRVLKKGRAIQEPEQSRSRSEKSGEGHRRPQAQSSRPPLTQERLKELLSYDPETGVFTWRVRRGRSAAGKAAGGYDSYGYRNIRVDQTCYKAHRLALFYVTGAWPNEMVDHVNGKCADNRFVNLREATRSENLSNAVSRHSHSPGRKGVRWCRARGLWRGYINHKGARHHVGYFEKFDEAVARVRTKREELHGEFANHG